MFVSPFACHVCFIYSFICHKPAFNGSELVIFVVRSLHIPQYKLNSPSLFAVCQCSNTASICINKKKGDIKPENHVIYRYHFVGASFHFRNKIFVQNFVRLVFSSNVMNWGRKHSVWCSNEKVNRISFTNFFYFIWNWRKYNFSVFCDRLRWRR